MIYTKYDFYQKIKIQYKCHLAPIVAEILFFCCLREYFDKLNTTPQATEEKIGE